MQTQFEKSLPTLLRFVFWIVALVLVSGTSLVFLPNLVGPRWPWALLPFNARFLGAVYLGELVAVIMVLRSGVWLPARLVLPQALSFTVFVTITSFIHLDVFNFQRVITWLWFILYIFPTLVIAYYLWLYRADLFVSDNPPPASWRPYLLGQSIVLIVYGLGLFLAPLFFSGFWPWGLDAFHGQIYSGIFIAGGLGAFSLWRASTAIEFLTQGLTQIGFSIFAIMGLIIVDLAVNRVTWSAPGVWIWIIGFAILAIAGGLMLGQSQKITTE